MKLVRQIKMYLNRTYSNISVDKYLSYSSPIRIWPALSLLPFSLALEYASRKVQESQLGLKLSRHQSAGQNPDVNIANRSFENVTIRVFTTVKLSP
jgi:hypothetical protein